MKKFPRSVWLQAITCIASLAVLWTQLDSIGDSEFRGGALTGILFRLANAASVLFVLALLLTFLKRRFGAALALLASFLTLPLYLYIVAPGLFRRIFPGEYSVPLDSAFVWNRWAVIGIVISGITAFACFRNFRE
jgi:hypothetical protein